MVELRTTTDTLFVYSHWHGSELPDLVRGALRRASERLHDDAYWLRIMVDQITAPGRDQALSWGLMTQPTHEDEYCTTGPSILADATTRKLTVRNWDETTTEAF